MALDVICGQPCSGKSIVAVTVAETLKESKTKQNVRIIDEVSFNLDHYQNYANMPAEKNLRGKLRSEVDRSVLRGDIIIVDSLNNIKGYIYKLWCIARAAGTRATQEVINAIVEQQTLDGAISRVTLGNELPPIEICRPIGLSGLRRLRRTFVKLINQSSMSGSPLSTDADRAKRRFVDYLNREFRGSNA